MTTTAPHGSTRPALFIGLGFTALAVAFSARAAIGLLMPIWEEELGWSRTFVSGCVAAALIVMAALAPFAGRLVDRQGARNVMILGLAIMACGSALIAVTDSKILFIIAFAALSAIGFGLVATHVVSTALEQQLTRNQGLGIGIATSGSTAGQFLIVPLIAVMITTMSWRWSYGMLAVFSVGLALAVYWLLPAHRRSSDTTPAETRTASTLRADLGFILRNGTFHLLFWSYLICGYTSSGVIETHLLPYAEFCGFGTVPSGTAYGLLSAINLGGMILAGWLTDKMSRPLLLAGIYLIRSLTFILLVNIGTSYEALLVFTVIFGLVDYSTVPVTASLVASHIGLRVMGLAFGLISAGHQVGGALGAFLGGYLFDLSEQYVLVWWSSFGLAVIAGLLAIGVKSRAPSQNLAPATPPAG
jgi:MFS family permease